MRNLIARARVWWTIIAVAQEDPQKKLVEDVLGIGERN